MALTLPEVRDAAGARGLDLRGAFHPDRNDAVAEVGGRPCATLVLLGNASSRMWAAFSAARSEFSGNDPLDAWSVREVGALADELGARALMPFGGPPWLPFVRWAQAAEAVFPSPIGPLVHPVHGLWHAYRGGLAFAERIELPPPQRGESPCAACDDKPCLTACPVGAFAGDEFFAPKRRGETPDFPVSYDVPRCVAHVASDAGRDCATRGCRARHACPVGRDAAYVPEQAAFHMQAFVRARRG